MCVSPTDEALLCFLPLCLVEISNFEADIAFLAERHDPDTRGWLFADINSWFHAPGDSRAYVLLGDAGVGKSVIAGALAKRAQDAGYLGAAYFCRHNDETRNDPRNLLGTIACQLCKCSVEYSNIVGGEGGVRMTLANSKLSIGGLFTKLLQEPLGKCAPCEQRKLVIIDALDETEYKSRDDFLDLVMHRFPRLPKWLLFFITSRPEDTVQFTLKNYNPCVKICAGYGKHLNVYQQHEQDIKQFLEKRVDFSCLPCTVEIVTKKCNGLFLYAFYMVEVLNNLACSGNIGELTELFPGDIDDFFYVNFKRIFDKVGADLFRTLFGCVAASPSPLPRSFISFLLKREKSNLNEQEVIDTVSIFLVHRASDLTFTFLHNLIPSWLTDRNKARRFFVDITVAREYLKKIVLEFLPSSVINVSSGKYSSIETDLLDYVLHVGVRLLCKCDDRDSMKIAHNFLTSYQFIQKRIQKSRIGLYSVIGDLKLSAGCENLSDTEKETLQGVCRALERNIHTLLECPHLLPSCLQMASKAVKLNMTIPGGVSTTWMEWSWLPFPVPKATRGNKVTSCFAFSPDRKLLAEVKDGLISLYNSGSLKRLFGPVEAEELADLKRLAFSSCGNFVFFGKINRAFSVERGGIETYSPLKTVHLSCEWCSFTLDRQHIVVKFKEFLTPTCWFCLLNHLCLWAKLEIAQSREREPLCQCFPHKLKVTRKHPQLEAHQGSRITAMRPLLNLLGEMKCKEWCSLLEKVQLNRGDGTFLVSDCGRCKTAEGYEALTLEQVRQFVIDHYFEIFKYQVLDVQTGKPVLDLASSFGEEVSPFIHFCHLGTAFEICGTLFTGICKALSLPSIALLSTICHHLLFRESRLLTRYLFTKFSLRRYLSFSFRPTLRTNWQTPGLDGKVNFRVDKGSLFRHDLESAVSQEECVNYFSVDDNVVLYMRDRFVLCALCLQTGTTSVLYTFNNAHQFELFTSGVLRGDSLKEIEKALALSTYTFTDLSNGDTHEVIEKASVLSTLSSTTASELENLPDEGKKEFFSDSIPCFSPGGVWVAKPAVGYDEGTVYLFRGRQDEQQHSNNPEYVIKEVAQFGFTTDVSFFAYLSVHNSLHVLSLQSGTILQSSSGVSPLSFIAEGQVGFHFLANDECKTLFLKDFPCEFLQHFLFPPVEKPTQANFVSDDTFLVLRVNSSVMSFHATGNGCTNTWFSAEGFVDFGSLGSWQVEKCAFSSDGKLIASHHGTMITLHDTIGQDCCRFVCSVFEADYEFSVLQLTFSANSAFLLFCIRNGPFFVWDVKKRETLASFDPPVVSEDFCCCITEDNRVVLCNELYIEIWDTTTSPWYLLTRLAIGLLYSAADKITYCTVSPKNNLLACCIVDRILLYSLDCPTNQPVLKLPRAHLGKIEFCRFLKENRYIISYGIDGALFLWDLLERTAISFIRILLERGNITCMTVSPKEDKVVGCTSFGRFFEVKLCGLKSEIPSFQLQPEKMRREQNVSTLSGAVCSGVEQIAEETDTSKLVEEMDFMCPSDRSEDSDGDGDESENSGADQESRETLKASEEPQAGHR